MRINIINLICAKEYATAHFTLQGMHSGTWRNTQPTGKYIDIEMLDMFRIEGGKICEQWMAFDINEIVKQITASERNSFEKQF